MGVDRHKRYRNTNIGSDFDGDGWTDLFIRKNDSGDGIWIREKETHGCYEIREMEHLKM